MQSIGSTTLHFDSVGCTVFRRLRLRDTAAACVGPSLLVGEPSGRAAAGPGDVATGLPAGRRRVLEDLDRRSGRAPVCPSLKVLRPKESGDDKVEFTGDSSSREAVKVPLRNSCRLSSPPVELPGALACLCLARRCAAVVSSKSVSMAVSDSAMAAASFDSRAVTGWSLRPLVETESCDSVHVEASKVDCA